MREIFHIFRKDVQRHWPEILGGLILLALYTHLTLKPPEPALRAFALPWFRMSLEIVAPLTFLFWVFISIRVVHGETLVGDRQWWITKPYQWWSLLAAKELFLLLFLNVPMFCVQLYLLHHAGFPALRNLGGIFDIQLSDALILIVFSVTLASVTRGFGQVMIGIALLVAGIWLATTTLEAIPNSSMSSAVDGFDTLTGVLTFGCIFGAVGWQYARRKTWAARGLVAGGALALWAIAALTPYVKFVERKYPVAESTWSARLSLSHRKEPETKTKSWPLEALPTIPLRFLVKMTDIPERHLVHVDGVRPAFEPSPGVAWDPGWQHEWGADFWGPSDEQQVSYSMPRREYDRLKGQDLRLRLELALTEYEESEPWDFVVREGEASDEMLGICRWSPKESASLECRKPFHYPALIAKYQPRQASCNSQDAQDVMGDEVAHLWFSFSDTGSAGSGFNPITNYQLRFTLKPAAYFSNGKLKVKRRVAHLCDGAILHLAKPKQTTQVRVILNSEQLRLEDLLDRPSFDFDFDSD